MEIRVKIWLWGNKPHASRQLTTPYGNDTHYKTDTSLGDIHFFPHKDTNILSKK